MQRTDLLIEPGALADFDGVILDCRFALADPGAGRRAYEEGHIPGAHHIDLEADLSAPASDHGGRHPLPEPGLFARRLASLGIGKLTRVVAYDDARFCFAARLWWMMRALGYRSPRLLNGGYRAWLDAGGEPTRRVEPVASVPVPNVDTWMGTCDIAALPGLQGQGHVLVDSREERRYLGLEEPIDPVAGHIPGAENRPWQAATDEHGRLRSDPELAELWQAIDLEAEAPPIVYCGSGVSACVNLVALAALGRDDAILYPGSWSDWCSYL